MAELGNAHITITWDTEPTDEAKAFIRAEVIRVLQELIGESSWLKELVQEEVKRVVSVSSQEVRANNEIDPGFFIPWRGPRSELIHPPNGSMVVPKEKGDVVTIHVKLDDETLRQAISQPLSQATRIHSGYRGA